MVALAPPPWQQTNIPMVTYDSRGLRPRDLGLVGGLEQFDEVARGVAKQDLSSSGAAYQVAAE